MKKSTLGRVIKWSAIGFDVICPLAATFSCFPAWIDRSSEATVSGLFVVFAFFSVIPFLKQIKAYLKSPSAPVLWAIPLALLFALRNIVDEMIIVCLVGLLSNIVGAFVYKIGEGMIKKADGNTGGGSN